MTERTIPAPLRRQVIERASNQCEYCLLPASAAFFPHEVDHVVAVKHGGLTSADNLAYACWRCNRHKGTDLGSFDPATQQFSLLFNPPTNTRVVGAFRAPRRTAARDNTRRAHHDPAPAAQP
jgi:HNH endonuclease